MQEEFGQAAWSSSAQVFHLLYHTAAANCNNVSVFGTELLLNPSVFTGVTEISTKESDLPFACGYYFSELVAPVLQTLLLTIGM